MKNHQDLLAILKANGMRITPARRALLQFILDNKSRQVSLKDIHAFMDSAMPGVDRSSIYRNIQALKRLDIIQELRLPGQGRSFQYILDRKVHPFYICKACGKANRGNERLFERIERALRDIHGLSKANLSPVFYGYCSRCAEALGRS